MAYKFISRPIHISRWGLFAGVRIVLDLAALTAAWSLAIDWRLNLNALAPVKFSAEAMRAAAPHPGILLLLWAVAAAWLGIYSKTRFSLAQGIKQAVESDFVACLLIVTVTFFSREFGAALSRSFVILFIPINLVLLVVAFYTAVFVSLLIEKRWPRPTRVAFLGGGAAAHEVAGRMQKAANSAFQIAGLIVPEEARLVAASAGLPVLGTTRQLGAVINRERLDRIIFADASLSNTEAEMCGHISKRMGVVISRPVSSMWGDQRIRLINQCGVDLLELEPAHLTRGQEFAKQAFDTVIATVLVVLLSPLLVVLGALVRLTSPGPIFYKSLRVGKGGRYFTFWKFRSMTTSGIERRELKERNECKGHLFKLRNDPRVTPLGRFMRHYSLDELPQLISVVLGDMSLVGPRPLPVEDLDPDGMSTEFATWAEQRAQVRPGITGLWQIRGRSNLAFEEMIGLDLEYVQNRSLALDLRILAETPLAVLSGEGAY